MSLWGSLTGQDAADASRAAAQNTYQKQIAAGEQANTGYQNVAQNYNPFIQTGIAGNNALMNLVNNPESLRGLPGWQFARDIGQEGLDRNSAARHMYFSGKAGKDLSKFNTGYADATYGNQFNRLQGLAQFGLGATGAQGNVLGQGLNAQYNSAYGGAGTIGQGDVAAEQAKMTGAQNLLGTAAYLGGSALGSPGVAKGAGSFLKGLFT